MCGQHVKGQTSFCMTEVAANADEKLSSGCEQRQENRHAKQVCKMYLVV